MTLGFVALVILQSVFFPPKIPEAGVENTVQPPAQELAGDEPQSTSPALAGPAAEPAPALPRDFLTLGSFDPQGGPLVVTLDTRGATVRRVELNARKSNGSFQYTDVDYRHAYIGQLEPESVTGGCQVNVATPGAPAVVAGIRKGDVIYSLNGEPVLTPADLDSVLAKLKPGAAVDLGVRRGEQTLTLTATSTRMPMQILRPSDPELLTDRELKRRSFQLTLRQQTQGDWPDLDKNMRFANWQSQIREIDGQTVAEFTFDLPSDAQGRKFQVLKRYSLSNDPLKRFHVNLEFEIRNLGTELTSVNYELCGPTGLPKEGWWYQQKIHGGTWAIGRAAGARDITLGSDGYPFKFVSGPQIVTDRENPENRGTVLIEQGASQDMRRLRFIGVDTLYFNVALIPNDPDYECYSAFALTSEVLDEVKSRRRRVTDISFVVYSDGIELPPYDSSDPATAHVEGFEIFAGPKQPEILGQYGLSETRTFGWFAAFSKPLILMLHWLYKVTFSWSYGLAIVLLTVIVRCCMIPISRKAALNAQMMQYLAPQMKELQDKYKEDPKKFFKARSELCARHNYKPLGGCLLMFVQLPIFLGLYRGLSVDVELRNAPLIPGLDWCTNLGGPDKLFEWSDWMPAFLGGETGFLGPYFNLLPVIAIVLMFMQQKLFMPPATDDQSAMAQKMMKFMMIFMGFVFFKVAAGLCIYFVTSSIWGIVERKMLPKPELDTSRFEADGSSKVATRKPAEAQPLRNDEQLEERKRRDRERKRKLRQRQ